MNPSSIQQVESGALKKCYWIIFVTLVLSLVKVPQSIMSPIKEWTIIYHGAAKTFKGRAEFLRLMLEDAGADYEITGENLYGPTGMMDCFRGSAEAVAAGDGSVALPNPVFFPPALWHRPTDGSEEVIINQVGACVMYIGSQLGYAPQSAKQKALADMITLNALDYIAEGRSNFHPVKNSMSYNDQKEEGDKVSKEWTTTRMPIWLAHFEKTVKVHGAKSPVAGGSKVTCADFVLFHVLDATIAQFNNDKYDHVWDKQNIDSLKEYYAWMKSRPNLKAYFESDRVARKLLEAGAVSGFGWVGYGSVLIYF